MTPRTISRGYEKGADASAAIRPFKYIYYASNSGSRSAAASSAASGT